MSRWLQISTAYAPVVVGPRQEGLGERNDPKMLPSSIWTIVTRQDASEACFAAHVTRALGLLEEDAQRIGTLLHYLEERVLQSSLNDVTSEDDN